MSVEILFVLIILIAVIVTIFLTLFGDFYSCKNLMRMKFKSFKQFYNLNHSKWWLSANHVTYNRGYNAGHVSFGFNFIDLIKYKLWLRKENRRVKSERDIKIYLSVIDDIKEDLAKFEEDKPWK